MNPRIFLRAILGRSMVAPLLCMADGKLLVIYVFADWRPSMRVS